MVEALGAQVLKLVRVRIGAIGIGTLPIGKWRLLTPQEVEAGITRPGPRTSTARSAHESLEGVLQANLHRPVPGPRSDPQPAVGIDQQLSPVEQLSQRHSIPSAADEGGDYCET
jgi:hypothetical protein